MTRRRDEAHQYLSSGEAPDWAGRVPCRTCNVPDWSYRPVNEHHKNYVAPEGDRSAEILGEHEEVSDDAA